VLTFLRIASPLSSTSFFSFILQPISIKIKAKNADFSKFYTPNKRQLIFSKNYFVSKAALCTKEKEQVTINVICPVFAQKLLCTKPLKRACMKPLKRTTFY
jgi:hypothetical protein